MAAAEGPPGRRPRGREREAARTFGAYAEDWLEHRELADRTRHGYRDLLDRYILPAFADTPLTEIDRPICSGLASTDGTGKPHRRKQAYDLFRAIMNTALDDELQPANPVRIRSAGSVKRTGRLSRRPGTSWRPWWPPRPSGTS